MTTMTTITVEIINAIAFQKNNRGLIRKDDSPNENKIYKLFSDGEITVEKGGFGYGRRAMFTLEYPLNYTSPIFTFPENSTRKGYTYTIMTKEKCVELREKMRMLFEEQTKEMLKNIRL